jgi:hypothetical protein
MNKYLNSLQKTNKRCYKISFRINPIEEHTYNRFTVQLVKGATFLNLSQRLFWMLKYCDIFMEPKLICQGLLNGFQMFLKDQMLSVEEAEQEKIRNELKDLAWLYLDS